MKLPVRIEVAGLRAAVLLALVSLCAPSRVSSAELTMTAKVATGGGGTCVPGGTSSAGNCPSWGGWVKPMPGTICTMNVGNNNPTDGYTNKVRNCSEATARQAGIAGSACDVINIIELNSDQQCSCACNPANLCKIWGPAGKCILDDPGRPTICKNSSYGYYEPDRCALCKGCGATAKPATCETQAQVICDPALYDPPSCNQVADKGCDCMCFRKGPCSVGVGSCVEKKIAAAPGCDAGNYGNCRKCDVDGDGVYDWGSCEVHPSHCNPSTFRDLCLQTCSTPILEDAAGFLAGVKVKTISGDMNCDPSSPNGCGAFGMCPWVSLMGSYGFSICGNNDATTASICHVDLVLSNFCGCNSQTALSAPGDHATIVYGSTPGSWTGPLTQILSANSASSCPDPDQSDAATDRLGASASCPTVENGKPVGACYSWGHVSSADVRYYTRADSCYLQAGMTPPKVLVCDVATATASATCTTSASSGSSSFVTIGKADASISANCSNGSAYNPPAKVVMKGEVVTPTTVTRSDGNLYFMVERTAHRDRGAECNATLGQPCTTPVQPVTGAATWKGLKLAVEACPVEVLEVQ